MSTINNQKDVQTTPDKKQGKFQGCLGRGILGLLVFLLAIWAVYGMLANFQFRGRGMLGALAVLAIMLIIGVIYQSVASARDLKKYPPPGKLYDVGGCRLHLYSTGEGGPTVILEAGGSSPALLWYLVQKEVAKFARVCSYDRAGFGWSDPASKPLSANDVAGDLHELLKKADIPGPYILVGHSIGGVYVRAFTHLYPSKVVGMVLVDSSHESQNLRYPPEFNKISRRQISSMRMLPFLARIGILRLTRAWSLMMPEPPLPVEVGRAILATMYRTSYCEAFYEEMIAIAGMVNQEKGPASLGDLPLIVLAADDSIKKMPEAMVKAIGQNAFEKLLQVAQEFPQELAGLSTRGRLIVVENSSHYIQWDQPKVVIDAIKEIVEQVRDK
ncbi:MAG: alpha/beta hydrolase [Anaerolineales bacterium]|nr:alpha/beta hydrolase [Anaerolineales bacterium]NTW11901.1 alpha/beta hydrolase [Anaerolineales bacterium]